MTVPLKAAAFLEEDSLGFVRKIFHQKIYWFLEILSNLKHDLLRLEVVPRGKQACFMIQVSQETWEILASQQNGLLKI